MSKRQPGVMITGAILLLTGGWLIAIQLGLPLMGFDRLWTLLLALVGIALLVQSNIRKLRSDGLLFAGIVLLLLGFFLSVFSLEIGGLTWRSLVGYWPVFFIIIGTAFMIIYLRNGMQNQSLLIPVYVFGGIGFFALPLTLGVIRGTAFNQMLRLWPLLLLLIGLAIFMRLRDRSRSNPS